MHLLDFPQVFTRKTTFVTLRLLFYTISNFCKGVYSERREFASYSKTNGKKLISLGIIYFFKCRSFSEVRQNIFDSPLKVYSLTLSFKSFFSKNYRNRFLLILCIDSYKNVHRSDFQNTSTEYGDWIHYTDFQQMFNKKTDFVTYPHRGPVFGFLLFWLQIAIKLFA